MTSSTPIPVTIATALGFVALSAWTPAQVRAQTPAERTIAVTGEVTARCRVGEVEGGDDTFDMGVLIDTGTGLLRRDLAAPEKVITGSFCNTRSLLTIAALPMAPEDAAIVTNDAFTRRVDFTATASGWTATAATFDTDGGPTQASAAQIQPNPQDVDLILSLSNFSASGGANRRPVASDEYVGLVTLTLTPSF